MFDKINIMASQMELENSEFVRSLSKRASLS